jgi:hydrophobic/amphiphilic exporter-1 (mainly G- bacteria), HAE1 family
MSIEEPKGAAHSLFSSVVAHPVAVLMMFLAALVFGLVSYQRLAVELMPDIAYPTVTVRTGFEGAAPPEVELQVSQPIEEALATLDGLVRVDSRSRAGSSDVVLGFDWGTDIGRATQSIRENLQTIWLPDNADRPLVLRYDPSLDPFLRLAVSVDAESELAKNMEPDELLLTLRELAEHQLKRDLEGMSGVAAARVRGGLQREVRVDVREGWLAARQLTLGDVRGALERENINIAGGSVLEGDVEYLIRTLNEFTTVEELGTLQIRRFDGERVRLSDVAEVYETHEEREVVSQLSGTEAVEIEIFKEADANVVEVAERVKLTLFGDGLPEDMGGTKGLIDELPEGTEVVVLDDQAAFVELALANLRSTALVGGFFAVLVLYMFLRDRVATAIVSLAIPVSVVVGMAPLYLWDVSLNLMSLGGLALGIGMLVDNAVVVLESIQRWREEGLADREAAVAGVRDVAAAVVASTLTTIAVFLPIAFVEGVAGELFGDLSLAVVASLLASLAVALLLVPTLAGLDASWLDASARDGAVGQVLSGDGNVVRRIVSGLWRQANVTARADFSASFVGWSRWVRLPYLLVRFLLTWLLSATMAAGLLATAVMARLIGWVMGWVLWPARAGLYYAAGWFQRGYQGGSRRYEGWLDRALRAPFMVVGVSALMLAAAVALVPQLGSELLPEVVQGRFTVELALPVGTPLHRTKAMVSLAEASAMAHPDVATVFASVGADRRVDTRADEGSHSARLRLELQPGPDLPTRELAVTEYLRDALAGYPELEMKAVRPALFSFQTPVEVVLYGDELDRLQGTADRVTQRLAALEGLRDVRSSLHDGHPEVRIVYDRLRLHRLGLEPAAVAEQVRDKVQGVEATQLRRSTGRIAARVQLVEGERSTISDLRRLNINPEIRPAIPLDAVADLDEAVGPSEIRRVDQRRAVVVRANLAGFDLGTVGDEIRAELMGISMPEGMDWESAGQSKEMAGSLASMRLALGLAIFLVYVIMASTFEHLVHPLVILFSVPLSVVGAVMALGVAGTPVSVVVLIGAIVLAGVVVNNAIVLVDTINRLRADGLDPVAAVRKAGALRLRPILITTATTVLGLAPLALGVGAGAEVQRPLAITIIGGLVSSTLLTLVVIPVVYTLTLGRSSASSVVTSAEQGA